MCSERASVSVQPRRHEAPVRRLAADGPVTAHELTLATAAVVDGVSLVSLDALAEDSPWALTLERTRPGRRPRRDGPRVALAIVNRTDTLLEVFWVDRAGSAVPYGALEPGARLDQQTSVWHLWRVRVGGEDLGDLVTPDGGGVLYVKGPAAARVRATDERRGRPRNTEEPAGARFEVREHDAWLLLWRAVELGGAYWTFGLSLLVAAYPLWFLVAQAPRIERCTGCTAEYVDFRRGPRV